MIIHAKKVENDECIYGALNIDITKYIKTIEKGGKDLMIFETKKHGEIYCDLEMSRRIAERLRINNFDNSIIINAINLNK